MQSYIYIYIYTHAHKDGAGKQSTQESPQPRVFLHAHDLNRYTAVTEYRALNYQNTRPFWSTHKKPSGLRTQGVGQKGWDQGGHNKVAVL